MKQFKTIILCVFILGGLGFPCPAKVPSIFKSLNVDGYSISYPPDWIPGKVLEFDLIFRAPPIENFSANLGIKTTELKKPVSLDAIVAYTRERQIEEYPQYEVLDTEFITAGGNPAIKHMYRWYHQESDIDITQIQYFLKQDKRLYVLTATALTDQFTQYESIFNAMVESLIFR